MFSYLNVVTSPCSGVSIPSCLHTQVFQKLDTAKDGLVTQTSIQRFYRQDSSEMEGVWFDHTHRTSLHAPITSINYAVSSKFLRFVKIFCKNFSPVKMF